MTRIQLRHDGMVIAEISLADDDATYEAVNSAAITLIERHNLDVGDSIVVEEI